MKITLSLIAVALATLTPVAARGQEVHAHLRLQIGATDSNYPGCHGRMLALIGGSVEIGQPLFLEVLGDRMGVGGDDCLPGRRSSIDDQAFTAAVITEPTFRVGIGVGHRDSDQHVSFAARVGAFVNTGEPFVSGKMSVRLFVFTAGVEFGQVNGRWEYEDGTKDRRWSTFGGLSVGVRF